MPTPDDKQIGIAVSSLLRAQLASWFAFALVTFVLFAVLDFRLAVGLTAMSWAIHLHQVANATIAHNRSLILQGLQFRDVAALGMAIEKGNGNFLGHLQSADLEYSKMLEHPLAQSEHQLSSKTVIIAFVFEVAMVVVIAALGLWMKSGVDRVIEQLGV